MMGLKMDEVTRLKWMEYSNDSQMTPPYSELLKFLNKKAQHFETVISEQKPQTTTHRSYEVTLNNVCVACRRGGNHLLGDCIKEEGSLRMTLRLLRKAHFFSKTH